MESETQQLELEKTYESGSISAPDAGLQQGLRSGRGIVLTCHYCGNEFWRSRSEATKHNPLKYCSKDCKDNDRRGVKMGTPKNFTVPESTRKLRVRASGLVDMRIRRGTMARPKECQWCDKAGRVDAHHPDYARPDLVAFLCRSCHMRCHHHPGFEKLVLAKIELIAVPSSPSRPKGGSL